MSVKNYNQLISILREQPVVPSFDAIVELVQTPSVASRSGMLVWLGFGVFLAATLLPAPLRLARHQDARSVQANAGLNVPSRVGVSSVHARIYSTHQHEKTTLAPSSNASAAIAPQATNSVATVFGRVPSVAFAMISPPIAASTPNQLRLVHDPVPPEFSFPLSAFASFGLSTASSSGQLQSFTIGIAHQVSEAFEVSLELQRTNVAQAASARTLVLKDTSFVHGSQQYQNVIGQYAEIPSSTVSPFSAIGIGVAYRNRRSESFSPIVGFVAGFSTSGGYLAERAGVSVPLGNALSASLEAQAAQLLKSRSNESLPVSLNASISYSW